MRIRGRYIGHCCFWTPTCIKHYFKLATPMSIYIGKRHWHVLKNTKRFERMWDLDNPVSLARDSATGKINSAVYREREP